MPKRSQNLILPSSNNLFLGGILDGIRKRTKPIKHDSWSFSVERVFEEIDNGRLERLDIELKPLSHHAYLNITVWEDRWVHVAAFERTKEEKWDWHLEGRLLPTNSGFHFVLAMEQTGAFFYEMTDAQIHKFDSVWAPLLARGPMRTL